MKAIKKDRSIVLLVILSIYCLLYFSTFMLEAISHIASEDFTTEGRLLEISTIIIAFLIFLTGSIYSWINEKMGGIILCIWHFIVWSFSLLIWPDAGMVLVLIFPILLLATFLIRNSIMRTKSIYRSKSAMWSISLKTLLINYAAIYFLIVLTDILPVLFSFELPTRVDDLHTWSLTSPLGIILMMNLILFVVALINSRKSEFIAGVLLIIWYAVVILLTLGYDVFANSGPWVIFGAALLLQGFLYVYYYYRIRNKA